tara:strand:+ start:2264 stop:3100 length:837 start_codon:yes stop_codon:yes gene_type:complete
MTIHRDMYDKTNNKQDVKMENENEEQPGEETEESPTPVEVEEDAEQPSEEAVEETKPEEEPAEENEADAAAAFQDELVAALLAQAEEEEDAGIRAMGLYGDINEEKAQEVINALIVLWDAAKRKSAGGKNAPKPFDFYISTNGGSADDMFAIYDLMNVVKDSGIDISTVGIGKVMSAGVLLLAAGTKGQRRIGRNCRVMIHQVLGGHAGSLHNLENEMDEMRQISDMYIRALSQETDMSVAMLKKLMERKVNVYLSAREAIEYGIADIIYGEEEKGDG